MKALRKLGMLGARRVARRLAQIEMQREQRREQIVLEALDLLADFARHKRLIEQIDEGLRRIERRGDELPRADDFAVGGLDADRAAVLDDDPRRLGHQPDLAAALAHRRFERARQRRRSAARHLRLGGARQQRRDVVAEAAHAQIDLAQAVEEQQAGLARSDARIPGARIPAATAR